MPRKLPAKSVETIDDLYKLAARRDGSAAAAVRDMAERASVLEGGALGEVLAALDARRLGLEASVVLLGSSVRARRDHADAYGRFLDATLSLADRRLPGTVATELRAFLSPAKGSHP